MLLSGPVPVLPRAPRLAELPGTLAAGSHFLSHLGALLAELRAKRGPFAWCLDSPHLCWATVTPEPLICFASSIDPFYQVP